MPSVKQAQQTKSSQRGWGGLTTPSGGLQGGWPVSRDGRAGAHWKQGEESRDSGTDSSHVWTIYWHSVGPLQVFSVLKHGTCQNEPGAEAKGMAQG